MSGLGPNLGKLWAQRGGDGGVVSGADDSRVSVPARRARGEGDNSCPKGLLSCRAELLVAAGTGGRAKKKKKNEEKHAFLHQCSAATGHSYKLVFLDHC